MNRTKQVILLWMFWAVATAATAQNYEGRVITPEGKPIDGVSVVLRDEAGRVVNFARSQADGSFSVAGKEGRTPHDLIFSKMGFAKDTLDVSTFQQGQAVMLADQAVNLREVRVKGQRIHERGDTLDYLVNSFKQKQDRSIADVLRKMPGIEVKENGAINFEGKPINKFYIEGNDLLGPRYVMASENIEAAKVKKVQVLRHHLPVLTIQTLMQRQTTLATTAATCCCCRGQWPTMSLTATGCSPRAIATTGSLTTWRA